MGSHDELVAAGSDDGFVFIYDAATGQVVKILQADEDVANCVQVALCHLSIMSSVDAACIHCVGKQAAFFKSVAFCKLSC